MHLFCNHGAASAFTPDAFYGREEELSALLRACIDGGRGVGASVMLYGPPETGKTSFLLKLKSALAGLPAASLPRPFPFYFAFSKIHSDPVALSGQFIRDYLSQLLAFAGAPPPASLDAEEVCDRLVGIGFPSCREMVAAHRRHAEAGDGLSALVNAFSAPFSAAASTVYPVFLLDDFQFASKIEGVPEGSVLSILRPYIKAGRYPILLSGSTPGRITASLKREGLYGAFRIVEMAGLGLEAAGRLFSSLCERRGLSIPPPVRERAVERLGGIPAYLRMFAEEVSFEGKPISDEIDFENLYAGSVTEGSFNRYWKELFESVLPDRGRRARAVRFLKRVLCDGFPLDSIEGALTLYGASQAEGEEVLAALEMKGLLRTELEHIEFHRDPVLEDFLIWGVERGVMGRSGSQIASGIVQARLARSASGIAVAERDVTRDILKRLMRRWDCREVPSILFDFGAFRERFGGKGLLEIMVALEHDPDRVRLPKISAVSSGERTGGSGSRFDFDLVAYGFLDADYSEDKIVAWAVDVAPGRTLTREAVEHFEKRSRLLELEKGFPPGRLNKWLLFGEAADPGAVEEAAAAGIRLSHRSQLRLFLNRFGMDEANAKPASPPEAATPSEAEVPRPPVRDDVLEFGLVLPMKADTEVVAARVAEEVAAWASLEPDSVDRLKMAIIEACINAFEHSGSASGKVHLRYVLSPGRIEIFVRDEGRGIRAGEGTPSGKNRGWGLKLMRELVDDVEIESGDSGTTVRLVKYVDGGADAADVG